ncbi:MAG: hypothetical protein ABI874_05160 [Chloroflexota bacterium]
MPPLSFEWIIWSLVNGVPALIGTLAFLLYPPFDQFAWDVQDRRSGIFLGTGFLFRMSLFILVITARSWGEIRWLTYGNAVFAAVLLGVTLIWGDIFKWSRPIAIIWLFLYIEEPVWMITLVPQAQAAAGNAVVPGAAVMSLTQIVLLVEAAVMLVAGVYLFFINRIANPIWPWKPDLVSARIMAGFPLGWTAWAVTLALAPTWGEARGGVLLNIVWLAAVFLSVIVFQSKFDLSQRNTRIYLGVIGVLTVALAAVYFMQGM